LVAALIWISIVILYVLSFAGEGSRRYHRRELFVIGSIVALGMALLLIGFTQYGWNWAGWVCDGAGVVCFGIGAFGFPPAYRI
jgi:hypothetical protein